MSKLLIANWKSNPADVKSAIKLAKAIDGKNVVIVPPAPFLESVGEVIKKSLLGAQNVFWADGPYTGEISAADLKIMKVKYVIIGHSERRKNLMETDEMINLKVKATLKAGLKAVLCVGEPLKVRRAGIASAKKFIKKQLAADLKSLQTKNYKLKTNLIVAYEPIWAISTAKGGKPDTPEDAVIMIKFIKEVLYSKFHILNPRVLYGGSVNAKNAKGFLGQKDIDGALVGGASLKPIEFNKIKRAII